MDGERRERVRHAQGPQGARQSNGEGTGEEEKRAEDGRATWRARGRERREGERRQRESARARAREREATQGATTGKWQHRHTRNAREARIYGNQKGRKKIES